MQAAARSSAKEKVNREKRRTERRKREKNAAAEEERMQAASRSSAKATTVKSCGISRTFSKSFSSNKIWSEFGAGPTKVVLPYFAKEWYVSIILEQY